MPRLSAALLAGMLLATPLAAQGLARFVHDPALSPDGSQLAFSYKADIWIVPSKGGRAERLTDHPAEDVNPVFSPDGQWLAFGSTRSGNADVWLLKIDGSELRRVTYHPGADGCSDFTPDGQELLFASRRYGPGVGPHRLECSVPVTGGTPKLVQRGEGSQGQWSPDGTKMLFVRGISSSNRRQYSGGSSEDVWVHDFKTGVYKPLTTHQAVDTQPLWSVDGQTVYFVSDRGGVRNLWKTALAGGEATAVTSFDEPVRNPSSARRTGSIAFEQQDQIWLLDPATGKSAVVPVTVPVDRADPTEIYRSITSGFGEYAVAPSGKEVAYVIRGDLYVTRYPDGGPTTQLTDTPWEEGSLAWSPDSKTLWYSSDQYRQNELFSITSADPNEPRLRRSAKLETTRRTTSAPNEFGLQYSPDGKKVSFIRGKGDLVVADPDLKNEKVLFRHWSSPDVAWSPDSRWIAFARSDDDYNADVFIIPAAGGEPVNVSQHPRSDYSPCWSGDGSKLGFLSDRENEQVDAYFVWLRRADWEKTRADRDDEDDDNFDKPKPKPAEAPKDGKPAEAKPAGPPAGAPGGPGGPGGPGTAPAEPKKVEIEWDGLSERLVRLTSTIGNESWLIASPDGKQFAYCGDGGGRRELFAQNWDGPPRQLTQGLGAGAPTWSPDGRQIRFARGDGKLGGIMPLGGPVSAANFEATVRRSVAAEWAYLYDAVWHIMGDQFYDPQMHGADWVKVGDKHRARAAAAPTRADFDGVVNDLLGELNASHQGFSSPRPASGGVQAGELGVEWDNDRSGSGLKVAAVVPFSPASKASSKIEVGERVLRINDAAVRAGQDVSELLLGTGGKPTTLLVADKDGKERSVSLRPVGVGEIDRLREEDWIRRMRALTVKLSGGKLGYTWLPAMDEPSLKKFEQDLFAAGNGREGLLIDVRFNGGGWTADLLLAQVMARPHAYTIPRDGGKGYPTSRLLAPIWSKSLALLCNGQSVSNAEILSHAFQVLKRGPVVGTRTYGGVISTGGTTLLDGSSLRLPGRGWYRVTDHVNQENNPCVPDIVVEPTPGDEEAGRDRQIEAAVKAVLDQLAAAAKG
ncbi:MAG: PD40 domain-containing protein [Fimbriimonadaceae bacterium]|nr:PD40 domain-containing protein [Fimbriimonadaceae bacterium]